MSVRALLLVVVLAARLDRDEDVRLPRDLLGVRAGVRDGVRAGLRAGLRAAVRAEVVG